MPVSFGVLFLQSEARCLLATPDTDNVTNEGKCGTFGLIAMDETAGLQAPQIECHDCSHPQTTSYRLREATTRHSNAELGCQRIAVSLVVENGGSRESTPWPTRRRLGARTNARTGRTRQVTSGFDRSGGDLPRRCTEDPENTRDGLAGGSSRWP